MTVMNTTSGRLPWVANSRTVGGVVAQRGYLAGDQPADHEDAAEREADDSATDDRALITAEETHVSEMQRASK